MSVGVGDVVTSRFMVPARRVWSDYYVTVDAIVFLVDSSDRGRFPEAKRELDVSL